MLNLKAVVHGVVDPTFAARTATEAVTKAEVWTEAERKQIVALRDSLTGAVAREVNRIESQLSLMLSHQEGEHASIVAVLRNRTKLLPYALGFASGTLVTIVINFIR